MGHDQIYILKKRALVAGLRLGWNDEVDSEKSSIKQLAFQHREIMEVGQGGGVKIRRDFQLFLVFRLNQWQFQRGMGTKDDDLMIWRDE